MRFKGKTVFITGATGFVGSNLARYFCDQSAEVHIAVRKKSNLWRINDLRRKMHFHFLDITDSKALEKVFLKLKPKYIYHLATYGAYSWETNIEAMIKTNIRGTLNLLSASSTVNYECFVNTGSSSEYGFKRSPMKEDMFLEPNSFYAITKACAAHLCSFWANKYKKPIVTFRLFSVYGPYEDGNRLIPMAMKAAILGTKLKLTARNVRRDFIYVGDVVKAFTSVEKIKGARGDVFNIGTGKQHTNEEVATAISRVSEAGLKFELGSYKKRAWDTDYWVADISKAKKILKWTPKYQLSRGLKETYFWFRENLRYYS